MSRAAEVTLAFGGEDRMFRLPIGRLRALQEKCDAGPLELLQRLSAGNWRVDDVRETILQGLIGGDTPQAEATKLVQGYFDGTPLADHTAMAQVILMAAVMGVEDEPPGELEAGAKRPNRSRARKSASQASTASAQPSAGHPEKSTT